MNAAPVDIALLEAEERELVLPRFEADGAWDVVDWKTGRRPSGAGAAAAAVQLAAYRLAWHQLTGAPLDRVRAAFFYVRDGVTVRPADLLDADALRALVARVPAAEP